MASVTAQWEAVTTAVDGLASAVTSYDIEYGVVGGALTQASTAGTSYSFDMPAGAHYRWRVRATAAEGVSQWSGFRYVQAGAAGIQGLQLEGATTCVTNYSEDISTAFLSGVALGSTIPSIYDGQVAHAITETAVSANHYARVNSPGAHDGVPETYLAYVKPIADFTWVRFWAFSQYANFNLQTGQPGVNVGTHVTNHYMEQVGDGWWKLVVQVSDNQGGSAERLHIGMGSGDVASWDDVYMGTPGRGFYVAGAETQVNSFETSHIVTAGAGAVTRAATSCIAPFTAIPELPDAGLTNDFCGQVVVQVDNDADMVALAVGESTGSMDNSYEVRRIGGTWQFIARRGSSWGSAAQVADASALADIRFRASPTDGMKIWVNTVSAEQSGETDPLSAPATVVQLDDRMGGGLQGFGIYKTVRLIPAALPDEVIENWLGAPEDPSYSWSFADQGIGQFNYTRDGGESVTHSSDGTRSVVVGNTAAFGDTRTGSGDSYGRALGLQTGPQAIPMHQSSHEFLDGGDPWITSNLTPSQTGVTSPYGGASWRMVPDAETNSFYLQQTVGIAPGVKYWYRLLVHPGNMQYIQVCRGNAWGADKLYFNVHLESGGQGNDSAGIDPDRYAIIPRCDGWLEVLWHDTGEASVTTNWFVALMDADTDSRLPDWTADGSEYIDVACFEMYEGEQLPSSMVTGVTPVNRAPEYSHTVLSDLTGWPNSISGDIAGQIVFTPAHSLHEQTDYLRIFELFEGGSHSLRLYAVNSSASGDEVDIRMRVQTSAGAWFTEVPDFRAYMYNRVDLRFRVTEADGLEFYIVGERHGWAQNASCPATDLMTTMTFGTNSSLSGQHFNGWIEKFSLTLDPVTREDIEGWT